MSQVWQMGLPTTEKMILLVLADHADDDGRNCWPSVATIARKASVSERQVQRLLQGLIGQGFIRVDRQAGGTRDMRDDRRPNAYTITLNGATYTPPREDERGDIGAPRGDIHDAHGVKPTSPKPSIEPSIEPPIKMPDPSAPATAESVNQRANRLTKTYTDLQPMSRFPAIAGIVKRAIAAGHPDDAITDALVRLAAEGRSVTVETLRIELEGMPAERQRASGTRMYVQAARDLDASMTPALEIER